MSTSSDTTTTTGKEKTECSFCLPVQYCCAKAGCLCILWPLFWLYAICGRKDLQEEMS